MSINNCKFWIEWHDALQNHYTLHYYNIYILYINYCIWKFGKFGLKSCLYIYLLLIFKNKYVRPLYKKSFFHIQFLIFNALFPSLTQMWFFRLTAVYMFSRKICLKRRPTFAICAETKFKFLIFSVYYINPNHRFAEALKPFSTPFFRQSMFTI